MKRNFKGVWIPKEVWNNQELTVMEKLFLVEIDSLNNEKGCFASNNHFSNFFNISKGRSSQVISSLRDKGLITISITKTTNNVSKRVVRLTGAKYTPPKPVTAKDKAEHLEKKRLFESWWELYNKKVGRGGCERKFTSLPLDICKKCLDVTSAYIVATGDVKFRKNPMTWLNQGCWDDDYTVRDKNMISGGEYDGMVF